MNYLICGKHTVLAAYNKGRAKTIYLLESNTKFSSLFKNVKIEIKNKPFFNKKFKNLDIKHQGFAALVNPIIKHQLNNLDHQKEIKFVALQGVEDQRNIGSIIRTCAAFNIDGLFIEKKTFNESSLLMNKTHAGNIEHLKIFLTSNVINNIKTLKKNNFSIYCLDQNSETSIKDTIFDKKSLLVFGSESKGLKEYIKKECDISVSIKINKNVESLNLSNAVAATLAHI